MNSPKGFGKSQAEPVSVSVIQTGDVVTSEGTTYGPSSQAMVNDKIINLIVDDFYI